MARSRRITEPENPDGGSGYRVGSSALLTVEPSRSSEEWTDGVRTDDSLHGLVIFDKDLRVQYVSRQARWMMERDGAHHTEFDPQASLSLHVVKVATKVQECWIGHSSEAEADVCVRHSFRLRDTYVTVTAFGMMDDEDALEAVIHVSILVKTVSPNRRLSACI